MPLLPPLLVLFTIAAAVIADPSPPTVLSASPVAFATEGGSSTLVTGTGFTAPALCRISAAPGGTTHQLNASVESFGAKDITLTELTCDGAPAVVAPGPGVLQVSFDGGTTWLGRLQVAYFEQIEIYRKVEFIGGVHGAAMVNMLYMEMGGKVLELRYKNDSHNNCYYSLSVSLKHKYFYQKCEMDLDDNLIADPNQLNIILKEIFND